MTITEAIQARLIGNATLTALVPAARIMAPGDHQNVARPYIVHFPVSVQPIQTHTGLAALMFRDYQVSVFAATYASGEAIANTVRDAMIGITSNGAHIFLESGPFTLGREPETDIEHFVVTFMVASDL